MIQCVINDKILGLFLDWRKIAVFYAAFTVITFLLNLLVPESPYWTMNFQPEKHEKVSKSIRWIYRKEHVSSYRYVIISDE